MKIILLEQMIQLFNYGFVTDLLFYLLGSLIGLSIHIFSFLAKAEENNEPVTFWGWLMKNKFRVIFSQMTAIAGMFIYAETAPITFVACILIGYTGNSVQKNLKAKAAKITGDEEKPNGV